MKLNYEINGGIPNKKKGNVGKIQKAIRSFLSSGHTVCEVKFDKKEYANAKSLYAAWRRVAKGGGVAVLIRGDRVFLMRRP